jgi:hypothetical protein
MRAAERTALPGEVGKLITPLTAKGMAVRRLGANRILRTRPSGKKGDVPMVEFTVARVCCVGLNGGPALSLFVSDIEDQAETEVQRCLARLLSGYGVISFSRSA